MFNINPYQSAIKKHLFEILKERYERNEPIIDQISKLSDSEGHYKAMATLIVDIYEKAFLEAVEQHREQLKQRGLYARVARPPEQTNAPKIFDQSEEKSG